MFILSSFPFTEFCYSNMFSFGISHSCHCSHCNSFGDASLLLEQLRSFDNRVYGVAHGLLMGSKEVWLQARVLFDDLKRLDSSTAAAFYNALTDMLWHFGQVGSIFKFTVWYSVFIFV